jgi:hypothetical protein
VRGNDLKIGNILGVDFFMTGWVDKPSIRGKLLGFRYRSNPAYALRSHNLTLFVRPDA